MTFYERDKELEAIRKIEADTKSSAKMAVITGRPGVGKTQLVLEATREGNPTLYFPVSRKAEPLLCRDFLDEMRRVLNLRIDEEFIDFRSLFKFIIVKSQELYFNIIIDEFQEFYVINPKVYGEVQTIWDRNRGRSHLCLLLVGSDSALIDKVFHAKQAPLKDRQDLWLDIKPYSTDMIRQLITAAKPDATPEDLLAAYTFTGGVPRYLHGLIRAGAFTCEDILKYILRLGSPYITEGRNILLDGVGKEYTFYFSILACIAKDITARSAIEATLDKEIGGYLTRMEGDFHLITRQTPLFSKQGSKNVRYSINDNFLRFWFRYIYHNDRYIYQHDYEGLQQLVLNDYEVLKQQSMRKYFAQKLQEADEAWTIGGWWDNAEESRIDIIATRSDTMQCIFANVLTDTVEADLDKLKILAEPLLEQLKGYEITYQIYSIEDL